MDEKEMKRLGEEKVKNEIFSKKTKNPGQTKKIGSSQIGQQMLLDEALRLTPTIWQWLNEGTWKSERKEWLELFKDEKHTTSLIMSSLMFMVGHIYTTASRRKEFSELKSTFKKGRHITIVKIDELIFDGRLGFDKTFRFIEHVVDSCSFLFKENSYFDDRGDVKLYIKYNCNLMEEIAHQLSIKSHLAFFPLPLTKRPRHWKLEDGKIRGGYTKHQYKMVRVSDDLDYSQYSNKIFKALNYIQSVRWRINEDVLGRVEEDLKRPQKEDYIKTEFPKVDDYKNVTPEQQELLTLYNAERGDFESAVGKWRSTHMAIDIAKHYIGKDVYFPHNYDFRGRVYPLPVILSPQGSDAIKAMLEFAEGEVLNKDGEDWCWAYLASLYGDDKLHFPHRVARGKELIDADYREADEPYQFLAHQMELQKYVLNKDYPVKTRIHLDACNSGSQFTSAITGDLKGCKLTNVIPHPEGERQDAYQEVANIAMDNLKEKPKKNPKKMFVDVKSGNTDENGLNETDSFMYSLLKEHGRKICKRPVMVSNYGGTAGGRTDILYNLFRELAIGRENITRRNAARMSKIIGDAIEGALTGGKLFEKYIQDMNNLIAKTGNVVGWYTIDGFYVEHKKNKIGEVKEVSCLLPSGKKSYILKNIWTHEVDARKMRSAISPNYVHSLDAMFLRLVALRMKDEGIENTSWIHDSFGTSPNNVSLMLDITKREFIKLVSNKPLKQLDEQLKKQAIGYGANEKQVNKIERPMLLGFNSRKGLNSLMESEWFFS